MEMPDGPDLDRLITRLFYGDGAGLLARWMTAGATTTRRLVLRAGLRAAAVRLVCFTLARRALAPGLVSHSGLLYLDNSSPNLLAAVIFGVRLRGFRRRPSSPNRA
jgi:hypothetical protein